MYRPALGQHRVQAVLGISCIGLRWISIVFRLCLAFRVSDCAGSASCSGCAWHFVYRSALDQHRVQAVLGISCIGLRWISIVFRLCLTFRVSACAGSASCSDCAWHFVYQPALDQHRVQAVLDISCIGLRWISIVFRLCLAFRVSACAGSASCSGCAWHIMYRPALDQHRVQAVLGISCISLRWISIVFRLCLAYHVSACAALASCSGCFWHIMYWSALDQHPVQAVLSIS
ncbi:hypothetical protein RRG08_054247 [Elysia crispata]|uniref:Uncharacterized protein n=1 Tax=Elysia crispata TaxID=231223 RepID=A0AAE0YCQ8_9GAST|nr:hypothetical protein RRG08_054247 [Elysia crispata]